MKVPFVDLKAQCENIRPEIDQAVCQVVNGTSFSGGIFVEEFEKSFASFCECSDAIGVGSGTEALWLALSALGVQAGDEVITVPNTFIATAEAISLCGGRPVFVDIEESGYNMDPNRIEAAITSRTKAIIPVHLFGQTADMDPILEIARKHGLFVVEDACQAHGGAYKGRTAGSMGDVGCFSFYPSKNLGAFGEAGAAVTNRADLSEKMRMIRDHGQEMKYRHRYVGWNARMDGLQGAILTVKLKYLVTWNEARRKHAAAYDAGFQGIEGLVTPKVTEGARHVYHIYAVRVERRDSVLRALAERGISCGVHYPIPIHLQEAYVFLGHRKGDFPAAERCAEELLSLPMFPELSEEEVKYVIKAIRDLVISEKY